MLEINPILAETKVNDIVFIWFVYEKFMKTAWIIKIIEIIKLIKIKKGIFKPKPTKLQASAVIRHNKTILKKLLFVKNIKINIRKVNINKTKYKILFLIAIRIKPLRININKK